MNSSPRYILSATNFSPQSVDAASVAAKLAVQRREPLRLVHVADPAASEGVSSLRRQLDAEARRLAATGAAVEAVLLESRSPSAALVDYVRHHPPVLIVVATSIRGPIDRWALGSFAEEIAESAPVPTLVVRNPGVFATWDWTKDRLTILLGLDFYSTSDVVLQWAKDFRLGGPCDLVACHVNRWSPADDEARMNMELVNASPLQSRLERELRRKVRDHTGDDAGAIIVRPHCGDPAAGIEDIAGEVGAHVIAVGAHQRHGLNRLGQFSVSRALLRQSNTNVVCVPIAAQFDPREAHIPDFRRVLVATDFSELGNAAVPFACAACALGGVVKLVHVTPPRLHALRTPASGWSADLRQKLRDLMPDEAAARCQPPDVDLVEDRDVANGICSEAERFGADLVCLASHGAGGSRALYGSVANGVLKKIRRPLLVIRRPEE